MPEISQIVIESRRTLEVQGAKGGKNYVGSTRSITVEFDPGELPLSNVPEDFNLAGYLGGLGNFVKSLVAIDLDEYIGDGEFQAAGGEAADEPRTDNQRKAIFAKEKALDRLGKEKVVNEIYDAWKEQTGKAIGDFTKEETSQLLDQMQSAIEEAEKEDKDGGQGE